MTTYAIAAAAGALGAFLSTQDRERLEVYANLSCYLGVASLIAVIVSRTKLELESSDALLAFRVSHHAAAFAATSIIGLVIFAIAEQIKKEDKTPAPRRP